jgi:hypothetical protein
MNRLVEELVRGILGEEMTPRKETVGIFAGGFKPPTLGHFSVVQKALEDYPEMDKLIVYVGSGERDSVSQKESIAVWRIYQKYLPSKVEIQPSPEGKPPVGKVYSYAKNNPDKNVYMLIGSREGNEGDEKDFAGKVRKLTSKPEEYPNLTAKKIDTGDGISGTRARKTILDKNKEAFYNYIPDIPEKEEIWNILSEIMGITENQNIEPNDQVLARKGAFVYLKGKKLYIKRRRLFTVLGEIEDRITLEDQKGRQFWIMRYEMDNKWSKFTPIEVPVQEYVDQEDVEDLDNLADRELNPIDVDLSGNHFFDRLNDPRNRPEIDYLELEDFFTKLGDNREKFIDFLNKYKSVVATDNETNINIPFMKAANKAIAKTIMRKRNFQTPDEKIELEETPLTDQDIIDDILGEVNNLQEIDLNKVKEKLKYYGKKGMLTLSILLAVANGLQANPGIAKDVIDTGIEMVDTNSKIDFYNTIIGYAQKVMNSEMGPGGDIELIGALKEVKLHYEALRDNKTPIPLSKTGQAALNSIAKHLSQSNKITDYTTYGATVKTLNEADPKKGTGKKPKGSGRRLYTDENPKDTVKVKFSTRQDIVDTLNKKSFKSKSHARQSQVINLIHQRVRAAYGRAKKPEVKKRLKSALDYITKRKEASKAKTKRLQAQKKKKKANENIAPNHNQKAAPFGSGYKPLEEDFKPYIQSLTDYMANNGLNLKPYPELEYIETDEENAENIFGRTAYYMPSEQKVVLYTLDRHPKDILRSYAHELIHHHQNLSGTLNHSNTTNTNEDGDLDKIEREAYETGNIMFRNWEDSLKNQKQ